MKTLFTLLAFIAALPVFAADVILSKAVSANTATNILSGAGYRIKEVYFANSDTTNTARLKIYDSSNTTTNYVTAATTTYSTVATNYSTIWTNEADLVLTNTFSGFATVATTISASTNERPKMLEFTIPKADNRTVLNLGLIPSRGVLVLSDQAGIIEITYERM